MFQAVASYIDDHYVEEVHFAEYQSNRIQGRPGRAEMSRPQLQAPMFECCESVSEDLAEYSTVLRPVEAKKKPKRKLEDLLKEVEDTFSENLFRWIVKKDLTNPEVYKKANMDRKLFSKILNNKDYKPSKMNALALAIALELNLDETKDFIGRAGYAMTHSSRFDIIVEWFILQKNYNIFEINEVLFAFDQPTIGG